MANQHLHDLVESMDDVIFTLDTAQRHTGVYGRWLEKARLSPEALLMKTSRDVFGADAARIHEEANSRALRGESVVYEWDTQINESCLSFQTRLSPIWDREKRKVIGLVGIGRDISMQREMETRLEAYQRSLEELVAIRTQELRQTNERLHVEILEREKAHSEAVYQAKLAESLRDVSCLLNRTADFDNIFHLLSGIIGRLIPHDSLSFMFCEGDEVARIYTFPETNNKHPHHISIHNNGYIQAMLETKTLIRLENVSNLPKSPAHDLIKASLSAPICFEDKILGFIHLGSHQEAAFQHKHEAILESFTSQIGIAVHNFQSYQKAQEFAVTQERGRIARDLHDAVTQTLFSANLLTETLLNLPQREYEEARDILKQLQHLSQGALAEMRTLLLELRPQFFENSCLESLIKQLVDAFYSRSQIPVEIIVDNSTLLNPAQRETLYRIAQEALNNIAKHSRAKKVKIQINWNDPHLHMCIEDDGIGFNRKNNCGFGLAIMRERAEHIGANLLIESTACGTKIILDWSVKHD